MNRSVRCFEKPMLAMAVGRTPFRQHHEALCSLEALGNSYHRYKGDLACTLQHIRQGTIPAERLSGLRTHAAQLQAQLAELLSLIPAEQPANTTQQPAIQP